MNTRLAGAVLGATSACLLLALSADAHNTNTTHPQIGDAALVSIASRDNLEDPPQRSAYAEFSYTQPGPPSSRLYWGDPVALSFERAESAEGESLADFRRVPLNVIDGMVQEDSPTLRVLSHFYHAYNGSALAPGGVNFFGNTAHPSAVEAFRYFDQAVEVFDGTEQTSSSAQGADGVTVSADSGHSLGLWLLGHALHHVEDMSSIAHVHNDSHLPVAGQDDDFEAQYIPSLLWAAADPSTLYNADGVALLNVMRSAQPAAVNSFDDIWPRAVPAGTRIELGAGGTLYANSLARGTYNFALFYASLELPWTWVQPGSPACPEGELAEMLNGPPGTSCGMPAPLHFDSMKGGWIIQNVGYFYSSVSALNEWWPVSVNYQTGPSLYTGPSALPEQGNGALFYIEELQNGEVRGPNALPRQDLLTPVGRRADFSRPWNRASNPVIPNTKPLEESIANQVMPLGVSYVAGLARLWYDIANPPPYLKHVVVRQDDELIYDATWKDVTAGRSITLVNKDSPLVILSDVARKFTYTKRRDLAITTTSHFINPGQPFTIELEFSEPIQTPTDQTFGLSFNAIPLPASKYEVIDLRPDESQPWMKQRKWLVRVDEPPATLNGRVRIGVRALDRNYHFTGAGQRVFGAALDANPRTPARRQRVRAGQVREPFMAERDAWLGYSWHTTGSRDVNFPQSDVPFGGFAYDQSSNGDESHILLFDSTRPTVTASVTYPAIN